jgi:signal transduction histidine kinase
VVEQPDRINASRLASAASILALAVLVSAVSVVVAFREARRLTAPLDDLAARAGGLGEARPNAGRARYGVPELDEVADALEAGAERIDELVEAERRLTTDASHQLRTPLTALSMRLEEILRTDRLATVREEATEALVQVERLAGVVDDLLVHRSDEHATHLLLPVGDVVTQQLTEWQPAFRAAGRALERSGDSLAVPVQGGPVGQVLSALLENALQHGGGRTTVGCRQLEGAVCVEVGDEGPGIPPDVAGQVFDRGTSGGAGTGLGLARARATAQSLGGRLELVSARPARFAVFLTVGQGPPAEASLATTLGNTQRR